MDVIWRKWNSYIIINYLCIFLYAGLTDADTFKIFMVSAGTCGNELFLVNHETSYSVVWKGDNPGSVGCKYRFKTDTRDSKLCVDVEQFFFEKSGIYLTLYEVPNSTVSKVYEKGCVPRTFCSAAEKQTELEIRTIYDNQNSSVTSRSHFTLSVYAKYAVENKFGNNTGLKVAFSVLGSLVALVVVAILFKLIFFRSRMKSMEHFPSLPSKPADSLSSERIQTFKASPKQPAELILSPFNMNVSHVTEPSSNETVHFNKDTEQLIV